MTNNYTSRNSPEPSAYNSSGDGCVHTLFWRQASQTPDLTAVRCGDVSLTYRELADRADRLAARLAGAGAGPNQIIGLSVSHSVDMVVGVFGILKSGAAYLPINTDHPAEQTIYMLENAGATTLVTQSKLDATPAFAGLRRVLIDLTTAEMATTVVSDPQPTDLAYVIYTSGSTGRPKAVAIEHGSLTNVVASMASLMEISEPEVVVSIGSFTFDVTLPDWLWALMTGGTVVLAPPETIRTPKLLQALINEVKPTHFQATPAMWETLLGAGLQLSSDVRVVTTGEHISTPLREQLRVRFRRVWNLYGPTETTVWSTACELHADRQTDSIGVAIDQTTLHVLAETTAQPIADGELGELWIGGVGLAREYLNNAKLTAERFVLLPQAGGERLYQTGDLVRRLPDGALAFHGRRDNQIKLRGFRIELGEINAALLTNPSVQAGVTVLREDTPGEKQIVAYVVPRTGTPCSSAQLRHALQQTLPEHMVPTTVVLIPALPLNTNGKIDRRALPPPRELTDTRAPVAADAPDGPDEKNVTAIWCEMLNVKHVGRHDSFLDLGGHSLLVIKMLGRLKRTLGWDLSYEEFLRTPTVALLCASRGQKPHVGHLLPLRAQPDGDVLVCLHGHDFSNSATVWSQLIGTLPANLAVWGLQGQGWDGGPVHRLSRKDIAADYARLIRDNFPGRRINLTGYCLGGVLAVDVAAQLQAHGAAVHRLVLIESFSAATRQGQVAVEKKLRRPAQIARKILNADGGFSAALAARKIRGQLEMISARSGRQTRGLLSATFATLGLRVPRAWRAAYYAAIQGDMLRESSQTRLAGRIDLIRSSDGEYSHSPHGWEEHAEQVTVHPAKGSHHGKMLTADNGRILAAILQA